VTNLLIKLLVVVALTLTFATSALADDADDARAAMRRGSAALERGDNEAALTEYEAAKKLVPSANAPYFFAAEALTRLSRWREAVENLETYLAKDPSVSDADTVKARIAKVKAEHFPGRVRFVLRPEGVTTTANILIDGRPASPNTNGAYELSPGEHHLDVSTPDRKPVAQDIQVIGDADREIPIDLGAVIPPTNPPPPIVVEPRSAPPNPWPTVGLITAGVGAAGLVTSFILDATLLDSKIDDYNRAANAQNEASAKTARSDFDSARTGVIVGYIASGVVLAGGVVLWLITRTDKKPTAGSVARAAGLRFTF
jgi:tetratricopeptide (TPR) repeat protein